MNPSQLLTLLLLSSIWGSSFMFMRIAVPDIGPFPVAASRVALGAVVLWIFVTFTRKKLEWKSNWKHYFMVGVFNLAVPMFGFSYAAKSLPSAYSAIMNATVPFWTALIATFIYGDPITRRTGFGIFLGLLGVAWISRAGSLRLGSEQAIAFLACLIASMSYAFTANYVKRNAATVSPVKLTTGGMLIASALLIPAGLYFLPDHWPAPVTWFAMFTLSIVCTAIAFLIFYDLVQKIGMNRAVLVTFLIPVFGALWAVVFLKENLHVSMIIGAALIFTGLRVILTPAKK